LSPVLYVNLKGTLWPRWLRVMCSVYVVRQTPYMFPRIQH